MSASIVYVDGGVLFPLPQCNAAATDACRRIRRRRCFGQCGWSGANVGYDSYLDHEKFKQVQSGHKRKRSKDGEEVEEEEEEEDIGVNGTLVCVMPEKLAERMVGIHHNCGGGKRKSMLLWRRWGFDEFKYNHTADYDPKKTVFPDW